MVATIGARAIQHGLLQPAQQFNPMQDVKLAHGVTTAPASPFVTGREGGNSGEIIKKLPAQIRYTPSNLRFEPILLSNQSLIDAMKQYAIPKQANDVLLKNMLQWYNDPRSKQSALLRREVGAFIRDQKLLISLRGLQANPKASKAQQDQARAYVLMAQGNGNRWQNKAVEFLSGLFGGKKSDPQKPEDDDRQVVSTTEQKQAQKPNPNKTKADEPIEPESVQAKSTGKAKKDKNGRNTKQASKKGPGSKSKTTSSPPQATPTKLRLKQAQNELKTLQKRLKQMQALEHKAAKLINGNAARIRKGNEGAIRSEATIKQIEIKNTQIAALEQEIALQKEVSTLLSDIKGLLRKAKLDDLVAKNTHGVSRLSPEDYAKSVEIANKFDSGAMSVEELKIAETQLKAIKMDLSVVIEYQRLIRFMGGSEAADLLKKMTGW
jgi:hypothetical protein